MNEVKYLTLVDHKYGLDIEVPGASILSAFGFDALALWRDVIGLAIFSGAFILIAYGAMHVLLVEKRWIIRSSEPFLSWWHRLACQFRDDVTRGYKCTKFLACAFSYLGI